MPTDCCSPPLSCRDHRLQVSGYRLHQSWVHDKTCPGKMVDNQLFSLEGISSPSPSTHSGCPQKLMLPARRVHSVPQDSVSEQVQGGQEMDTQAHGPRGASSFLWVSRAQTKQLLGTTALLGRKFLSTLGLIQGWKPKERVCPAWIDMDSHIRREA